MRLLLCTSVVLAAYGLSTSEPAYCALESSGNCQRCNAQNVEGGYTECGWCVPLLQCVGVTTGPGGDLESVCNGRPLVTREYKCDDADSTPTFYAASENTGPTNGSFSLSMDGENFGIDWKNGTIPGDTRRNIIMHVGPFNCSAADQSPVVQRLDPVKHQQPFEAVNCSHLPGIGQNLRACAETRGSDLCNFCGHDAANPSNSTCPTWLPPGYKNNTVPGVVQNGYFNYSMPKLSNVSATCLDFDDGVCMIKKGGKIFLNGSNFPSERRIAEIFDTKVMGPDGKTAFWDPWEKKGLRITLGADYNCTDYPDVGASFLSCTIGPGAGTNLSLKLEVGGVHINASEFGYEFRYKGPVVHHISPTTGPSYGGQRVTVYGEGFGVHADLASVVLQSSSQKIQLQPISLTDTQMVFVTPASNSDEQLGWGVSVIADGQPDKHNTSKYGAPYTQQGCADSCKMPRASGTCWPKGVCQCTGVFIFSAPNVSSPEASCVCDVTDPCGHGHKDCANNKCLCSDDWTTSLVGNHSLVESCTVCDLSCSALDKEVTGGSDCHCTFNKLHLIWIIGIPLLLLIIGLVMYCRYAAAKEAAALAAAVAAEPLMLEAGAAGVASS